jgi:hypothetical protein
MCFHKRYIVQFVGMTIRGEFTPIAIKKFFYFALLSDCPQFRMIYVNRIILVTVLLVDAMPNLAQGTFGLRAGANFATLGGDVEDATFRVAYHGSVFFEDSLSGNARLIMEVGYSSQGASHTESDEVFRSNYGFLATAIRIGNSNVFFQGGLQIGLRLEAYHKLGDDRLYVSSRYNTVDISIPLGVGVRLSERITLSALYNHGISNILSRPEQDISVFHRLIMTSIHFNLFER